MMRRGDLKRLMADVLDGVAESRGEDRLNAHLAKDPEARARFEDARRGERAMADLSRVAVPEELRVEIRRAVALEPQTEGTRMTLLETWRCALRRRPAFGLIPAFAFGALVGIAVFASITEYRIPLRDESRPVDGTMISAEAIPGSTLLDRRDIGSAEFAVWRGGEHVTVRVSLTTSATSSVDLAFDAAALQTESIRWTRGAAGVVEAGAGHVRLSPRGIGQCEIRYAVAAGSPASIQATVLDGGQRSQAVISTGP